MLAEIFKSVLRVIDPKFYFVRQKLDLIITNDENNSTTRYWTAIDYIYKNLRKLQISDIHLRFHCHSHRSFYLQILLFFNILTLVVFFALSWIHRNFILSSVQRASKIILLHIYNWYQAGSWYFFLFQIAWITRNIEMIGLSFSFVSIVISLIIFFSYR